MARIKGIDLPKEKRGIIGLTYIYGIGSTFARNILKKANVSEHKKIKDWSDEEANKIRGLINDEYTVCLLYTSPSPRDTRESRIPSYA